MANTRVTGRQVLDETLTSDDIADAAVRGATANGGSQREIALGTVSDVDLRDDAVTPAKLDQTGSFSMAENLLADGSSADPSLAFSSDPDTGMFRSADGSFGFTTNGTEALLFIPGQTFIRTVLQSSANGNAAGPSYAWTDDPNTGFYRASDGVIAYSSNGTQRLSFSSTGISTPDGAVGTPAFTFLADPNTGFYRIGTDVIGLATGGSEALRVDSNQNMAIGGTTNTSSILTLTSTTKAFMPPRMSTTQRNAIVSPLDGMMIFNTTTGTINIYDSGWGEVAATETDPLSIHLNGDNSPSAAIDWNQQELQQMVVHKLSSDPVSPAEGQIWYNTTTKQWKGRNDTTTVILG